MYLFEVLMENGIDNDDYYWTETTLKVADNRYEAELKAQAKYSYFDRYTATKIDKVDGFDISVNKPTLPPKENRPKGFFRNG